MPLPDHTSIQQLAGDFGQFFIKKIEDIRCELDIADCTHSPRSSSFNGHYFTKFRQLTEEEVRKLIILLNQQLVNWIPYWPVFWKNIFLQLTEEEVRKLIMSSKSTTCELDPIPTSLLKEHISILLPLITKMVNLSLQTGVFPNEWKLALVTPLIKEPGLDTILINYRPVSNLCFVSKISEWAVISQQKEHIDHNCSLPILSSAYRQGHSTESALLKVHADILHNMEQQMITLLVLIDLSAAFDTVDHPILFQCLEKQYGFHDSVLSWDKSYLSDRKQCVILKGMHSNTFDLPFGVPQGSCLGPVLFTQYASSLFSNHSVNTHAYADDHQLYMAFSPNLESQNQAVSCMESCLDDAKSWMISNKLKMND